MIKRSNITWTDYSGGDANFVIRGRTAGDCEVSPGCANCYAGAILRRNSRTPEQTTYYPDKLARLARWQPLDADVTTYRRGRGSRPMVFVCDMGDLFHEAVPDWFILDALGAMAYRGDVDWQVLTKRPARMADIVRMYGGWPANVWAGVTVEDQTRADERIPLLLKVPAQVRLLSCEPLLGPLDLTHIPYQGDTAYLLDVLRGEYGNGNGGTPFCFGMSSLKPVNWVIVGGESGPRRRAFDVTWARVLRDQCQAAGVAFFYKQGTALRPGQDNFLDGRLWQQFPRGGGK